jgi:hypothetical protein
MSAARIIYPPMSGRDRRHFSRELHKGEQEHARLVREAEAAYAAADRQLADGHRFDCLAWSARLFIGGPDEPSPTIAEALHGGVPLLEAQCRHCSHGEPGDLALVVWPRDRQIHTLQRALLPTLSGRVRQETTAGAGRPADARCAGTERAGKRQAKGNGMKFVPLLGSGSRAQGYGSLRTPSRARKSGTTTAYGEAEGHSSSLCFLLLPCGGVGRTGEGPGSIRLLFWSDRRAL